LHGVVEKELTGMQPVGSDTAHDCRQQKSSDGLFRLAYVFYSEHWVPTSDAARLENKNETVNQAFPRGPIAIVIKGGGVILDEWRVKNVTSKERGLLR